jgi:3-isopropylmalate dehydrogenase
MMLNFLGEEEAAGVVEKAVTKTIANHLKSMEAGKMGIGTREIGDLVVKYI